MIIELLEPKSVVDLGCNTGAWVAGFKGRSTPASAG
jgi:hypothetical protein